MRRILGKFAIATIALLALYLLVLWTEWFPLSTPAGKKAVAVMSSPLPTIAADKNAFSEMWLFPYDIPETDKTKVMATDIGKFTKADAVMDFYSSAEGKYPRFEDNENLLCKPKTENCLDKIRANPGKYHELFSKHEKLVNKADALTVFEISQTPFRQTVEMPLVNFGSIGSWQLTTAAYWHLQGKQLAAIDLTCRTANSWRGFAQNSHGLIDQMVGLAFYANATGLLAELLSENPKALELPASCEKAYLPVSLEKFPICRSMQMEYQVLMNSFESMRSGEAAIYQEPGFAKWTDKLTMLWFNKRASNENFALNLASHCSEDKLIMQTINKPRETSWMGLSLTELVFNPVGGAFSSMTVGTYTDYSKRMQNLSLTQQAMQAVLAERELNSTAEISGQKWKSSKELQFNALSKTIEVDLYRSAGENQLLSLPLAGSRLPK